MDLLLKISKLAFYPACAFCISLVLTPLCIKLLPQLGYLDLPRGRHIHEKTIPRGGGIAIIISFAVTVALYFYRIPETVGISAVIKRMGYPALILIISGLIDDRFELKSLPKLLIQCLVGVLVWYNFDMPMTIYNWEVPRFLALIFTVLWILIVVNAFNLIDGLDGLATGISIISATCLACWFFLARGVNSAEMLVMLVLVGASLGFLPYNFHPAKIFLGDTGSTFLGFCFAVSGLGTLDRAVTFTSLLLPMLVIGVPIFDVLLAVWRRSVRKLTNKNASGIMEGDQDHLHHRLLRKTRTQSKTAWLMYCISLVFAFLVILFILLRDTLPAIGYFLLLLAILIMLRRLAMIELFDSVTLIRNNLSTPRKGLLTNMLHPLIDLSIFIFAAGICSLMLKNRLSLFVICYLTAPAMLLLFFSKTYRVYWLRASAADRLKLLQLVFCGSFISSIILAVMLHFDPLSGDIKQKYILMTSALFILLTSGLIYMERFFIHYAESLWVHKFNMLNRNAPMRTIIFGGGINCRIFINHLYCAHSCENEEQIIGILDDDKVFHGMHIYGFNVYGGSEDISRIYELHPFDKLVITPENIDKITEDNLLNFCRSNNIKVTKFTLSENEI